MTTTTNTIVAVVSLTLTIEHEADSAAPLTRKQINEKLRKALHEMAGDIDTEQYVEDPFTCEAIGWKVTKIKHGTP